MSPTRREFRKVPLNASTVVGGMERPLGVLTFLQLTITERSMTSGQGRCVAPNMVSMSAAVMMQSPSPRHRRRICSMMYGLSATHSLPTGTSVSRHIPGSRGKLQGGACLWLANCASTTSVMTWSLSHPTARPLVPLAVGAAEPREHELQPSTPQPSAAMAFLRSAYISSKVSSRKHCATTVRASVPLTPFTGPRRLTVAEMSHCISPRHCFSILRIISRFKACFIRPVSTCFSSHLPGYGLYSKSGCAFASPQTASVMFPMTYPPPFMQSRLIFWLLNTLEQVLHDAIPPLHVGGRVLIFNFFTSSFIFFFSTCATRARRAVSSCMAWLAVYLSSWVTPRTSRRVRAPISSFMGSM
mmetsp:Transcript_10063/g.24753  ORF Transcript_10063/g.24753 Transcript_10063/m.24753 type:complete len:357 (-) Transcript_10063:6224-7294(-)